MKIKKFIEELRQDLEMYDIVFPDTEAETEDELKYISRLEKANEKLTFQVRTRDNKKNRPDKKTLGRKQTIQIQN